MKQRIFILGATGKVGKELVSQIYKSDTDPEIHKNPSVVVGLASRTSYVYKPEGIETANAIAFSEKKEHGIKYKGFEEIISMLRDTDSTMHIVDVTCSGDALALHKGIIESTTQTIAMASTQYKL